MKVVEIIWTQVVLSDLNEIAEYITVVDLVAAKKLVQTVFSKVERLVEHPESGKVPLEISKLNYRELVVQPCRVFYKLDGKKIFILHVMLP